MMKFIVKRLLLMIPVLLGVVFIVFTINQMTPGDPVLALLGTSVEVGDETYNAMAEKLGVDQPFFVQFFNYVKNIVTRLDLGTSYDTRRPVITEIGGAFSRNLTAGADRHGDYGIAGDPLWSGFRCTSAFRTGLCGNCLCTDLCLYAFLLDWLNDDDCIFTEAGMAANLRH